MSTSPRAICAMTPIEFWKWDINETLTELDRKHNVFTEVDWFLGWHLAGAEFWKPKVYRIILTRETKNGHEMIHGFCSQDLLRVAREQNLIKSNGFMLP